MSRKSVRERVRWTEDMISDLLSCKANAITAVKSENPPIKPNGRRFGYTEYMYKLWEEKGYGHFNLSSQNLSDQARRLECKQTEFLSSISQTVDEQRNIVINTQNVTVNADENVINRDIPLSDVHTNSLDDEKINRLIAKADSIYGVISIDKGDFSKRTFTTRLRATPSNVEISYIHHACGRLIQKHDLENMRDMYLVLWYVNCIVYSVVNAWIIINDVKGMECSRKSTSTNSSKRSSTTPRCVQVIENEIKETRARLSKCSAELTRLKGNGRITKRTKRNREAIEKECGKISHYSLVCYIARLKKRLRYLAKKRIRKLRSEKEKKLNSQFKKDQKAVFDKFRACIDEDKDNLKPVYKEKIIEKRFFDEPKLVEKFWRELWEKKDSGNPEAPWVKEIENKFREIIPNVYEGELEVTKEVCWGTIRKKKNWSAPGPDRITNFWWKKLTNVLDVIVKVFVSIFNELLTIERWLCVGRVALLPKPGEWSASNQRPITCLNTLYKWITSVLRYFHKQHLDKHQLLQIDQRGAMENSSGTVNNLLIDDIVLRDARLHQRNLFCYWIDVRKAFDSVSHSWLVKMLEIHRFPGKLVQLFTCIMRNWSVQILIPVKDGYVESGIILLSNGILQGDSYCPDLYILSMNVVSWVIRASEGYKLHAPISTKITHGLYIDDLKGYVTTLRKLIYMLNLVETYMKDAGLLWNEKKCKFVAMKKGKFVYVDNITLSSGKVVKCLKEDERYEFMGVPQSLKMDAVALANDLLKTVQQRSYIIWSSGLSDANKVKASNIFVNSAVEYYFWAVKFPINLIREMDTAMRESMNITGSKHTHLMNAVNYLPRISGGRGLRSLEQSYKTTKIKLAVKLMEDNDERVSIVKTFHDISKDTNSYSIFKDAEKYSLEVGLNMNFNESTISIVDTETNEIVNEKYGSFSKKMKAKVSQKNHTEILNSTWQGVNSKQRIDDDNVVNGYFSWLEKWSSCPTTVVQEFFLLFYQLLPTKTYKMTRSNEVFDNICCRMCNKDQESVKHLISNCGAFANSLYVTRHDNALKCFVWPLLSFFNLSSKFPCWYANDKVSPYYEHENIRFWWDVPEYTGRDVENQHPPRPDGKLIINSENDKRIYLLEMTVPWTENRPEKYLYKCNKYRNILQALQFEYPNHKVEQITLVMDVFGGYGRDLIDNIGKVFESKDDIRSVIKNMQKSVVSSSANLSRTFKIRSSYSD